MTSGTDRSLPDADLTSRSGRYTGRVEQRRHPPTEAVGPRAISAPERDTSVEDALAHSERRGRVRCPPERPLRRVSGDRLLRIDSSLSARDFAVLRDVDRHRFLTTHHLQQFCFSDHATVDAGARVARRVLKRLEGLAIVERLEHRVGGVRAGASAITWRVGLVGDQILRLRAGYGVRARRKEPSARLLAHCLAIADVHLMLRAASTQDGVELVRVQTEPDCWRDYLHSSGMRLTLKPDLYSVLAGAEYEDHLFIEVDLGTESLPTLIRKCQQYETYRRSGAEQHANGVFPSVLWVLPSSERASRLTSGITASRSLDPDLFRVTTFVDLSTMITEGVT